MGHHILLVIQSTLISWKEKSVIGDLYNLPNDTKLRNLNPSLIN